MPRKCEICVTNRGEDSAVLAARLEEIKGDLIRRNQKEFS